VNQRTKAGQDENGQAGTCPIIWELGRMELQVNRNAIVEIQLDEGANWILI